MVLHLAADVLPDVTKVTHLRVLLFDSVKVITNGLVKRQNVFQSSVKCLMTHCMVMPSVMGRASAVCVSTHAIMDLNSKPHQLFVDASLTDTGVVCLLNVKPGTVVLLVRR